MIRRIFSYAREYKRDAFLAPVFVVLETSAELVLPLLMAAVIDDGIQVGNLTVVLQMGVLMLLMAAIAVVTGTLSAKFAANASIGIGANIRQAEFDRISQFSFGDIDRFSSASLITRLTNDITNIQNFSAMCIRMLFRCLTQMIVALVVVFVLEWV